MVDGVVLGLNRDAKTTYLTLFIYPKPDLLPYLIFAVCCTQIILTDTPNNTMQDVQFKIRPHKADKSGRAPVYLYFCYNASEFYYATSEKCTPSQWDAQKQRFKRSFDGYQIANELLDALKQKLILIYRQLLLNDEAVSNEILKTKLNELKPTAVKHFDLIPVFVEFVAFKQLAGIKPGTLHAYLCTLSRLKSCQNANIKLVIDQYNQETHRACLLHFSHSMMVMPNTVALHCQHLITFFSYCTAERHFKLSPQHAVIKRTTTPGQRVTLTVEELNQINNTVLTGGLEVVRDCFLLQCYTGLRYSDLQRLDMNHLQISGNYHIIRIMPNKSIGMLNKHKTIEIPVNRDALQIIQKYHGKHKTLIRTLNIKRTNALLKEVGRLAGIYTPIEIISYKNGTPTLVTKPKYELLTTHVARHTCATILLNRGVSVAYIQSLLGHADMATTMRYAKVAQQQKNTDIIKAWQED